mmetsp:Transcript_49062/g.116803  ORF Transcript_49062/g.116803 Transcript_49062/m.116803 type:complete len:213 (-) Transcript_49062:159-797(-)
MRTTSLGALLASAASARTLSRDPHGANSTSMQSAPSGCVATPNNAVRCGCRPSVTKTPTSRSSSEALPRAKFPSAPRSLSSATVSGAPSARRHSARKTDLKAPTAIGRSSTVSAAKSISKPPGGSGRAVRPSCSAEVLWTTTPTFHPSSAARSCSSELCPGSSAPGTSVPPAAASELSASVNPVASGPRVTKSVQISPAAHAEASRRRLSSL